MAKKGKRRGEPRALATNRAASHEYHLLSRIEAGIALTGTEVKSFREGRVSLKDAYARIREGEVFLHNCHVSPYTPASRDNVDPIRVRKLLLHAREIRKLAKQTDEAGMTLVATRAYIRNGKVKIELAVARGKRTYDKREASRRKDAEREMARERARR
jgi:SsrA-binding protein